jgi:hypothetical protein
LACNAIGTPVTSCFDPAVTASPSELVFPDEQGKMLPRHTTLEHVLRRACSRAGLVTGYVHKCRRHACGHHEAARDANPRRCPRSDFKHPPRSRWKDLRGLKVVGAENLNLRPFGPESGAGPSQGDANGTNPADSLHTDRSPQSSDSQRSTGFAESFVPIWYRARRPHARTVARQQRRAAPRQRRRRDSGPTWRLRPLTSRSSGADGTGCSR